VSTSSNQTATGTGRQVERHAGTIPGSRGRRPLHPVEFPLGWERQFRDRRSAVATVVVGIDESGPSRTVLGRAIEESRRRQADLHVVHVFQPPVIFAPYMGAAIDTAAMAEAEREAIWGEVEPHLSGAGVSFRRVDLEGHPARALVAHAATVAADLLVIGSRGRGDLASLVLGSTSHAALHLAECDVLVVKGGLEGTDEPAAD
jgi:nucleotide-binding universal stress UspA family protein